MKKTFRTAWLLLGFCCSQYQSLATNSATIFDREIQQIRVAGCNAPIDLTPFQNRWEPHFKILMGLSSNQDVMPQIRSDAELQLSGHMEELVNLLMYNYNEAGLKLLKAYGSHRAILRLATVYFDRSTKFSEHNPPPAYTDLKKTAVELYLYVWNQTKALQTGCIREFTAKRFTTFVHDLQFECLPESLRQSIFKSNDPYVQKFLGPDTLLADINADALEVFSEHLLYAIDPFFRGQMQRFAWCANYTLAQAELCKELYAYEKKKRSLESKEEFPCLKDWLQAVNPKPQPPKNSTELLKSDDSETSPDRSY